MKGHYGVTQPDRHIGGNARNASGKQVKGKHLCSVCGLKLSPAHNMTQCVDAADTHGCVLPLT